MTNPNNRGTTNPEIAVESSVKSVIGHLTLENIALSIQVKTLQAQARHLAEQLDASEDAVIRVENELKDYKEDQEMLQLALTMKVEAP